jgi:hypothetical protein
MSVSHSSLTSRPYGWFFFTHDEDREQEVVPRAFCPDDFSLSWGMTADGVSACRIGAIHSIRREKKASKPYSQNSLVQMIQAAL